MNMRQLIRVTIAATYFFAVGESWLRADEPGFTLLSKAQPDEFYHGLGRTYYPLGQQPGNIDGQPKVNQAYIWSMVHTGDAVWFGTAANPTAAALGGIVGVPIPNETSFNVFEFWRSQYPGIQSVLKFYLGDWRPPQIYRYDSQHGAVDVTPDDPLIQQTIGFRSAGATAEVVLLGGPSLSQLGINLFAFDAVTGAYLGAKSFPEFADIRRWINVDGGLYTATLNTWTTTGSGSVLRWRGSRSSPFDYEIVGLLDNEGAALCQYRGRLFAFTWSTLSQSIETLTGMRSQQPSGVWMSPLIPPGGLRSAHARSWRKVWSASQYDPDPVIVRSLWMGACAAHDGYLIWGTIQVPGYGAQVLKEVYGWPADPAEIPLAIKNSVRQAALFRASVTADGVFQPQLLYGAEQLLTYSKTGEVGTWTSTPNGMGPPLLGGAGFGDPYNFYVWSMLRHAGRLYIGTFDTSFVLYGNDYVAGRSVPDTLGADLLVMDASDQPASVISRTGIGNFANNGIRDMVSDGDTILLGTATCANLLTNPADQLVDGGWELKRFDPAASRPAGRTPRGVGRASRGSVGDVDWNRLRQPLGQMPP